MSDYRHLLPEHMKQDPGAVEAARAHLEAFTGGLLVRYGADVLAMATALHAAELAREAPKTTASATRAFAAVAPSATATKKTGNR